MKRTCFIALAAVALSGLSGIALAQQTTPNIKGPKALTDSEMDRVIAAGIINPGLGLHTAIEAGGVTFPTWPALPPGVAHASTTPGGLGEKANTPGDPGIEPPGGGLCTAGRAVCP